MEELKFSDLEFNKLKRYEDGIQAMHFFDNGYGALIQKHEDSDGYPNNYEICVLKGHSDSYKVYYNSIITDDHIGNLTESQVIDTLSKIKQLQRVSNYTINTYGWWYDQIIDPLISEKAKDQFIRLHNDLNMYTSGFSSAKNALMDYGSNEDKEYWRDVFKDIKVYDTKNVS